MSACIYSTSVRQLFRIEVRDIDDVEWRSSRIFVETYDADRAASLVRFWNMADPDMLYRAVEV